MKNFIEHLKHIAKDPVKNIAEADARKKEILPFFYGSLGIFVLGVILCIIFDSDIIPIISVVALFFTVFLLIVLVAIEDGKKKLEWLTCGNCHALPDIKTPAAFAKYVSYTVEKDQATSIQYSGHKKPSNGVFPLVKLIGSASAVVSVTLTCPHCGKVRKLKYYAEPFKCHAEATRVGALQYNAVRTSLETAVRAAMNDYNNPDKKSLIPYSVHSSNNPRFAHGTSFISVNKRSDMPQYMGVTIDYHKDVEEMLEHYFIFTELAGSLVDPTKKIKFSLLKIFKTNSGPTKTETPYVKNDFDLDAKKPSLPSQIVSQGGGYPIGESPKENIQTEKPKAHHPKNSYVLDADAGSQYGQSASESDNHLPLELPKQRTSNRSQGGKYSKPSSGGAAELPRTKRSNNKYVRSRQKSPKTVLILIILSVVLILGGILYIFLAGKNGNETGMTETNETFSTEQETAPEQETTEWKFDEVEEVKETVIVDQSTKINMNDYVGYWNISGNQKRELTIHSGDANSVHFSLWYSTGGEINNATAQLQDNNASFSLAVDGAVIKGSLTFNESSITAHITQSAHTAMPIEVMEFTELYMASQVYIEKEEDDKSDSVSAKAAKYLLPFSAERLLTEADLHFLTKNELRLARNEIFARHGRLFEDKYLQDYFDAQEWYFGHIAPEDFSQSVLSDIELANISFIRSYQQTQAEQSSYDDEYEELHLVDIISKASVSSEYGNDGHNHSPKNLYDGDKWTNWTEGESGAGIGEYIMLNFDNTYAVKEFTILIGCHYKKDSTYFEKNNRPSAITLRFSDGSSEYIQLEDSREYQTFTLSDYYYTDYVIIIIEDVYAGTRWDDTVISEVDIIADIS